MSQQVPLPTLLSQALIAFTIECDNEFEHRMLHSTALRPGRGPWLTSWVMWSNFLRLIPPEGIPLRDVEPNARITNLAGLERWGYVRVQPDGMVTLKPGGVAARNVWPPIVGEVEERWRSRYGTAVDELRAALSPVANPDLPLYLPVVGYADGMRSDHVRAAPGAVADDLGALLAQALLTFTLEYEKHTRLSLPMNADVIRMLNTDGVRVRDLPRRSGVSTEGLASAVKFLERRELVAVEPEPSGRGKRVRLTPTGVAAQAKHARLVETIEDRWPDAGRLRAAAITGPRLADGLTPYPDGWRAAAPYAAQTRAVLADPAGALPHHPMVLHRGGYPDGS